MHIGSHKLSNCLILAPMAGVTDRPFRQLCRRLGAGLAVSEMVSANALVRGNRKTQLRLDHDGETGPVSVQIVGSEPEVMARAAQENVAIGADIIDINMGCPAKKVCNKQAGSALLDDESLVGRILDAVVSAVDVPVTLKIRTGSDPDHRNACHIARMAEQAGIQAIAVHGRTRSCAFRGDAEYDTIAAVKQSVAIPVIANGDITTPAKAATVLQHTDADALMIGRAARGNPWIFHEIALYLQSGRPCAPPDAREIHTTLVSHLQGLYDFYGEYTGVRVARKHIAWYAKGHLSSNAFRREIMLLESADQQLRAIDQFFGKPQQERDLAA
jgi:tRNA-dihydrouridine synthase B